MCSVYKRCEETPPDNWPPSTAKVKSRFGVNTTWATPAHTRLQQSATLAVVAWQVGWEAEGGSWEVGEGLGQYSNAWSVMSVGISLMTEQSQEAMPRLVIGESRRQKGGYLLNHCWPPGTSARQPLAASQARRGTRWPMDMVKEWGRHWSTDQLNLLGGSKVQEMTIKLSPQMLAF